MRTAMRGLTIPRLVRVESKATIGKEVIVDPTDRDEGLTAEQLSATGVIEYRDLDDSLGKLRAEIKAKGLSFVARSSSISRRQIQAIVNQRARPHTSTVEKIEAALGRSGRGGRDL